MSEPTQPLDTQQAVCEAAVAVLDAITKANTAFPSFRAMIDAPGYRPTFYTFRHVMQTLADAYDNAQTLRGDPRRASRVS